MIGEELVIGALFVLMLMEIGSEPELFVSNLIMTAKPVSNYITKIVQMLIFFY